MNIKRSKWFLAGNRVGKTRCGGVLVTLIALGKESLKYMVDWPTSFLKEFNRLSVEAETEEQRLTYAKMANEEFVNDLVEKYRHIALNAPRKARIWVCSESYQVQRDVTQKELIGDPDTLDDGWVPKCEIKGKLLMRAAKVVDQFKLKNGAIIGFKSYDQGRRMFQGTSQHIVWEDEEPPKDVRDEIRMRLLDTQGLEIGTMTPLSGLTHIYDAIYLNDSKPPESKDPEVFCLTAGWDDNPYLNAEEKKRLEANMDEAELEARKYGHFISPGKCSFNTKSLKEMLEKCYPGERGNLEWKNDYKTRVEWVPDEDGDYEVWFHPNDTDEYLCPADVAEGLEHGDYDAVGIINRNHLRLDAVYHGHIDPDELSNYNHKLLVYYKEPLAAPEGNNHGLTTISHLKQVYNNIYRTTVYDKTYDEEREKIGWYTTTKTRPLLIDAVKRAVRQGEFTCYWRRFVDEAMNFIRHPGGKEAARSGYWDDAVIMVGIGIFIHNSTPFSGSLPTPFVPGEDKPKAGWHKNKDGQEVFVHQSTIDDMERAEWGED